MNVDRQEPKTDSSVELGKKIQLLLNHIHGYSDIVRTDAIFLDRSRLVEYFRGIVAEAAEIKRIVPQIFSGTPDDKLIADVLREEIARHLYVIKLFLEEIPKKLTVDEYGDFTVLIAEIQQSVHNVLGYFEQMLHIPSGIASDILHVPACAAKTVSDDDLPPPVRYPAPDSGTIILAGKSASAAGVVLSLANDGDYHVVTLDSDKKVHESVSLYDVTLICYDCADNVQDGERFLCSFMDDALLHDIPLLMLGNEYHESVRARFIRLGAVDFYAPGKSKAVLEARLRSAVTHSKGNFRRQLYIRALEMNKSATAREFTTAATYVSGMLPQPFANKHLSVDWVFLPSLELGGDIFGYSWLSAETFAVYLIDVSGHGLEASLFSVTIMNLLKNQLLREADFFDPASVLTELNMLFKIEEQNNMFFTAWYGIYNTQTRLLKYSSAGSQPAVLYPPESNAERLATGGIIVGVDDDALYENAIRFIAPGSLLYIFSDGIFEIPVKKNTMLSLGEFIDILGSRGNKPKETCYEFVQHVEKMSLSGQFTDDVSMLEISFFD